MKTQDTRIDGISEDRDDYKQFLAEFGITRDFVEQIRSDLSDHIDMPDTFAKAMVTDSPKHESGGTFSLVPLSCNEIIGPARIGRCRTFLGRMTNHSQRPNCKVVLSTEGNLWLVAQEHIDPNTELTLDYRQAAAANPAAGLQRAQCTVEDKPTEPHTDSGEVIENNKDEEQTPSHGETTQCP